MSTPELRERKAMTRPVGMGSHESHTMGTDIWLTPRRILDPLGEFDLDPCSAPDPVLWPTAKRHITLPDDGLSMIPWDGRVWLNPPYGRNVWKWIEKLADHGTGTALIFARTETVGFVEQVWDRASAILFLHARIRFHQEDGSLPSRERGGGQAGAPSCLVAYGAADAAILRTCGVGGSYVSGWTNYPTTFSLT